MNDALRQEQLAALDAKEVSLAFEVAYRYQGSAVKTQGFTIYTRCTRAQAHAVIAQLSAQVEEALHAVRSPDGGAGAGAGE